VLALTVFWLLPQIRETQFECRSRTVYEMDEFTGKGKVFSMINQVPFHEDIFCLIKYHAMETHWESEGIAPYILNNVGTRRM